MAKEKMPHTQDYDGAEYIGKKVSIENIIHRFWGFHIRGSVTMTIFSGSETLPIVRSVHYANGDDEDMSEMLTAISGVKSTWDKMVNPKTMIFYPSKHKEGEIIPQTRNIPAKNYREIFDMEYYDKVAHALENAHRIESENSTLTITRRDNGVTVVEIDDSVSGQNASGDNITTISVDEDGTILSFGQKASSSFKRNSHRFIIGAR